MAIGSCPALVGIDLGTSSIKVGAFDPQGRILVLRRCATPTTRGADGWAEHNPEALWQATLELLRQVREQLPARNTIDAIACTSVGESGVALDAQGNAVRPAIAWFDSRSVDQVAFWKRAAGMAVVNRITGQPLDPHYGVNKLLWIRENEPAAFEATRQWLSLADLIVLRLCGVYATDRSLASRIMLFDQRRLAWSEELLAVAGLSSLLLPEVHIGGTMVGGLLPLVAKQTGIPSGTPVTIAGHDRLCGAFAARGGNDIAVDSTGSAEAIVLPVKTYVERSAEEAGYVSCYADVVPGQYIYSARVGYAGALVDWMRREFGSCLAGDDEASLQELEAAVPIPLRFSGLLVYPSFGRTLALDWNPASRGGAILGLTLAHRRPEIFQAILEGICFSMRERLDWLQTLSGNPSGKIRAEGGAARSDLWLQLKADISGHIVEAVQLDEPTALGAALLGGVSVGLYASHAAASRAPVAEVRTFIPDGTRRVQLDKIYGAFLKLPKLIAALADFEEPDRSDQRR
jgi:xylulokinase